MGGWMAMLNTTENRESSSNSIYINIRPHPEGTLDHVLILGINSRPGTKPYLAWADLKRCGLDPSTDIPVAYRTKLLSSLVLWNLSTAKWKRMTEMI